MTKTSGGFDVCLGEVQAIEEIRRDGRTICQHAGDRNGSLVFCAAGQKLRPIEDCELCMADTRKAKEPHHV